MTPNMETGPLISSSNIENKHYVEPFENKDYHYFNGGSSSSSSTVSL
jgi:hypothetical protein